jgi:hypothetical protein
MRISRLFKRLRRWSSQAFRKRHSPPAFRTCRNLGNSILTARKLLRREQEALVVRLNFVFLTDSVSELYGQRMYQEEWFGFSVKCGRSGSVIRGNSLRQMEVKDKKMSVISSCCEYARHNRRSNKSLTGLDDDDDDDDNINNNNNIICISIISAQTLTITSSFCSHKTPPSIS